MKEKWKPIRGYEGLYEISNYGVIVSLPKRWIANGGLHQKKLTFLKPKFSGKNNVNRYKIYTLCNNGKRKNHSAHTLVYDHFGIGKRRGRKLQIDHKDNNKTNNRIDNLQLLSARANISKSIALIEKPSKYVGVYWHSRDKKWGTQIHVNNRRVYLGLFIKEKDAYNEYQRALKEFEGTGNVTSKVKKRICTNKYKGVLKVSNSKNWQARITINGKRINLGCFPTECEAHLAYKKALTDGGQVP